MIESGIQKILDINKPQTLTIKDRKYFDRNLIPIKEPEPTSLGIHTLTGIVDYVKSRNKELDMHNQEDFLIHIHTHTHVFLTSPLFGDFQQRFDYIAAEHTQPVFQFGQFMDIEKFIISLQSMFVGTLSTTEILRIIGNLKDGTVKTLADDGVSQSVTTKTGVATVDEVVVPNPVSLQPFRTFPEIEQPESLFVFRLMSGGENAKPSAALFEADGGGWKNEAIQKIKAWLSERLPDIPIIA